MPDDPDKGLKLSPLKVNQGLGQLDDWNENTIKARAEKLCGTALDVWPAPELPANVLAAYQPTSLPSIYTIADHPLLLAGKLQKVFEAFRKEVLVIDPCVSEEFFKLYVAYKAETNFVDVIPQVKRLRLILNVSITELNDPRGLAEDISGSGHWGTGDVGVSLSSLDNVPYVMSLVRQAFERQMGVGNDV